MCLFPIRQNKTSSARRCSHEVPEARVEVRLDLQRDDSVEVAETMMREDGGRFGESQKHKERKKRHGCSSRVPVVDVPINAAQDVKIKMREDEDKGGEVGTEKAV